jgi:predicted DCC family thiol-disulfide oxidoreductase YuxK
MITLESVKVVFFDGHCHLCDGTVRFLLKHDRSQRLRFAPLQSEGAKNFLTDRNLPNHLPLEGTSPGSVLYWNGRELFIESSAALEILRELPYPWPLFRVAHVIPRGLRDAIYRWVARNRYRWFGKSDSCRLPSAEERKRFL